MIDALMLLSSLGVFLLLLLSVGRPGRGRRNLGWLSYRESPKADAAPTPAARKGDDHA